MAVLTQQWGDLVFAPHAKETDLQIALDPEEAHHLRRVIRARTGAQVTAVDGRGVAFFCELQENGELEVRRTERNWGEERVALCLACAVLKGDGCRDVVDLATALGANQITFFDAERSEGQIDTAKLERLKRVAIAAMKQCGRSVLPSIEVVKNGEEVIVARSAHCTCWLAHPTGEHSANTLTPGGNGEQLLIVGPEGGLKDEEVSAFLERGARLLHLGERRLRSELAAAVGLITLKNCPH